MAAIHQRLGLEELPQGKIVGYLARLLAAFYAITGILYLILAHDIRAFGPVIAFIAGANICFGAATFVIDLRLGLPAWWTWGQGPFIIPLGSLVLWLQGQIEPRDNDSSQAGDQAEGNSGRNSAIPVELPETVGEIVPTEGTFDEISRTSQDFKNRLDEVQAKSGDIQISLLWDNYNDLDLSCVDPLGVGIDFENRKSPSRGEMDVDMNASPQSNRPIENIHWPKNLAPKGTYKVYVNYYRRHQKKAEATGYILRVSVRGRERQFKGSIRPGEPRRLVYEFEFHP